jgi:hypothetical protein
MARREEGACSPYVASGAEQRRQRGWIAAENRQVIHSRVPSHTLHC